MSEIPNGTITDWGEPQWDNFSFWLESLLREETIEVVFTKSDGTERVMHCTKKKGINEPGVKLLEEKRKEVNTEEKKVKPKRIVKEKAGNITVWDIEAGDWRSFRVRSLTNILTLIMKYDYREPEQLTWDFVRA